MGFLKKVIGSLKGAVKGLGVSPTDNYKKDRKRQKWISAGGVVLPGLDPPSLKKVYVIKPSRNFGPWGFPKGKVEKGESLAQAALREVGEETGLVVQILPGGHLGSGEGDFSTTHFYLMVQTGGSPGQHDAEIEEVRLVTWDEARKLFQSEGNRRDVKIVDRALKIVAGLQKKAGKHAKKD